MRKAVLLIMTILLTAGCEDDPPTSGGESHNYAVYFANRFQAWEYYRYYPQTGELDTLPLPFGACTGLTTSADGHKLYVSFTDSTLVVDLENGFAVSRLPDGFYGQVVVAPNNRCIAVLGSDLYILRLPSYSIMFQDTASLVHGAFSKDSKGFYAVNGNKVYHLNLDGSNEVLWKEFTPEIEVWDVVPSVNEDKLYLYVRYYGGCLSGFKVYDIATDSVIYLKLLQPGVGEIKATPYGEDVFFSNSDFDISWCLFPDFTLAKYNVEVNDMILTSLLGGYKNGVDPPAFLAIALVFTPDGKWLVSHDYGGTIVVINPETMTIERYHEFGYSWQADLVFLTCQNGR